MTEQSVAVPPTAILPSERPQPPTLAQQISTMEHQFALAAPRGVEARQIVRDALTALRQNPELARCEPMSVLGGLMTMAQLGLRVGVNGLGHGWLIPFKTRARKGNTWVDEWQAQLIIGYKGLVELAYRSGQIAKISARTVHANDHFDVAYGLDEHLTHRPAAGDRGEPTGYYATVKVKGVTEAMFYYMTHAEMEVYRDRFAMAKKRDRDTGQTTVVGPWRDNFEAMAHKTCLRQLSKFMPKGTDLAVALAADDTVRVDISPDARPEYVSVHPEPAVVEQTAHVGDFDQDAADEPTDLLGGAS